MKIHSLLIYILLLFLFLLVNIETNAQIPINLVRYNDDFSKFKSDSCKRGFQRLKYIPLSEKIYISFGGEVREQVQRYNNLNFGDIPTSFSDSNPTQLWHRLLIHSNIEIGAQLRFFIQLNNTLRLFNKNPVAPEIDENQLSLHQAFAEVNVHGWKLRIGRQEMYYGNHRLITVREGPNTRKAFDGIILQRMAKNSSIDFIVTSPIISRQYIFDDQSFKESLIGFYGTQYFYQHKFGIDYYTFDFKSNLRKYNYQSGFENRQTFGARIFSSFRKFNFEVEGSYQVGKFADLKIDAYNLFADLNIMLMPRSKSTLGFTFNVASGDKSIEDKKLNTYNLLYAKPAYGLAIPIGSTNIKSVSTYLKVSPMNKFSVLAQVFLLARNSNQDGTYSPGMIQNRPKPNSYLSINKTLGTFYLIETTYQQNKSLSLSVDASFFKAGSYPKSTGNGKDISYMSFKSSYKF